MALSSDETTTKQNQGAAHEKTNKDKPNTIQTKTRHKAREETCLFRQWKTIRIKKHPRDNPNASSNTCQRAVFPSRKETKKPKRDANNQMRNIHNCGDFKFGRWEGEEKERGQCGVSKRLLGDGRGRRLGRLPRQLSASPIFSSNSCFLSLLSSFICG